MLMTKRALVPVSIGLILAASYILIGSLELNRLSLLLTTVSALVVVFSKLNPLWLIAIGVGLGLLSAQSGAYWFGS